MKTLNSTLVAELSDILKLMGRLNSISLDLQYEGENLLRYRFLLRRSIELTAKAAVAAEPGFYPRPESYYKSLADGNLSTNSPYISLMDLKTLTQTLTTRFDRVEMAYGNMKILRYFIHQLNAI